MGEAARTRRAFVKALLAAAGAAVVAGIAGFAAGRAARPTVTLTETATVPLTTTVTQVRTEVKTETVVRTQTVRETVTQVQTVTLSPALRQAVAPDPIEPGPVVKSVHTACLGCNVRCGVRVKVVRLPDGREIVERIEGNPYHPHNRDSYASQYDKLSWLPYRTPISEALKRSGSLCARAQSGVHYVYDPYRVLKPLKRAGPRGSGKWKEISWEQLIREVVEGGVVEETGERLPGLRQFFVYGKLKDAGVPDPSALLTEMRRDVDALVSVARDPTKTYEDYAKALSEFKTKWSERLAAYGLKLEDVLIDPDHPDKGTLANAVVYMRGRGQHNMDAFSQRWIFALGSVNWLRHTSSCQLAYYTGNYMWCGFYDIQADPIGAKVLLVWGGQMGRLHPGATGQGSLVARAARGEVKVYYINPTAPRAKARGNIKWVPIRPGTDAALAMAIIRWLIENRAYDASFLSAPNPRAARARGYPVHTNATWLVIAEPGHKRFGEFLRARDVGLADGDKYVVFSAGAPAVHDAVDSAEIFYSGRVTLATGETVTVKTAAELLREEAFSRTLEEWSRECGVPVELIVEMARAIAENAPRAGTIVHRGAAMHPQGEYTTWAIRCIDTLIGNFHRSGGQLGRPSTTSFHSYLYHCATTGFGEPPRWGPFIDRHAVAYEDSLEYLVKVKKGEKPYPARRPWNPMCPEESYNELFAGIAYEYPYPVRVLILQFANPVLAANYGLKFAEVLKDTKKLQLFIGITTTINETYLYADYIVPDTTYLETGTSGVQFLYAAGLGIWRAETWRSPAIRPLTEPIGRCPQGHVRYASAWEFFIDVGKALGMPGYGDGGIPGTAGRKYAGARFPLHCYYDFIMRVFANAAANAQDLGLIPREIPDEEVAFVEANYPIAEGKEVLPPDEWRAVCYGLARGGVFMRYEDSFDEKGVSRRSVPGTGVLLLWNEKLAKTPNSVTGVKFWGGPKYFPPATYAPLPGRPSVMGGMAGTPIDELYPAGEYPLRLVFFSSPLYTKHRSLTYYWIKQIAPENLLLVNPKDAGALGISTGDVAEVETPFGSFTAPVLVDPSVAPGVVAVPYSMGRWAETLVRRPGYFKLKDPAMVRLVEELPERAEVPETAINAARNLPELQRTLLFTGRPAGYAERAALDAWRFNGFSPCPTLMVDPSLENWPLASWLSAAQAYFTNPVRLKRTGERYEFESVLLKPYVVNVLMPDLRVVKVEKPPRALRPVF